MSGANRILKKNQTLFTVGEASNGMYLIRKGELQVFIPGHGEEVNLAKVQAGGLIGEMSLFDHKPRSASVRALEDSEVTVITVDDFDKLMKQIPKWFVALMTSLSSRLRETNDRLQGLEQKLKGNAKPFENIFRILNVLLLLFYKDGDRGNDKNWSIDRTEAEAATALILGLKPDYVTKIVDATIDGKLFDCPKGKHSKQTLAISNRGNLKRFIDFLTKIVTNSPEGTPTSEGLIQIVEIVVKLTKNAAYTTVQVKFSDVLNEGVKSNLKTEDWQKFLPIFKDLDDAICLVKISPTLLGFKVTPKAFPRVVEFFRVLSSLNKNGAG